MIIEIKELRDVGNRIEVTGFILHPIREAIRGPGIDGSSTEEERERPHNDHNARLSDATQRFENAVVGYTRVHLGKAKLEQIEVDKEIENGK